MTDARPPGGSRRGFFRTCLATATLVASNPSLLARAAPVRHYNRVLLVDEKGEPIRAQALTGGGAYIFHYPHVTTPCFLLDIGRPLAGGNALKTGDGEAYEWQGGAGPGASVVAFSAICAHKLSYPTRTLSFLNYRAESTPFMNGELAEEERKQIIYCCSERSVYDPARGAEVLGGPARQPLAAIELEYEAQTGRLYAVGTRGGELYEEFFRRFGFKLALDHGIEDVRALAEERAEAVAHERYSAQPVTC